MKGAKNDEKADEDEYVEDDTLEADVDDTGTTKKRSESEDKKKPFSNFQKKGYVPNITSVNKRAPGISKGLWKKELKRQITGSEEKK